MDEILIEDKKYVSSKQAAKITGYAKDYIGQLCREGRVPARLVGRSWYVLESAINDHRFGEPKSTAPGSEKSTVPTIHSTWEAPRYEASETEVFPSVNRPHDADPLLMTNGMKGEETSENLQNAWQAWFDRFDSIADTAPPAPVKAEEEAEIEQNREIKVPIRAIPSSQYRPPPEGLLPRRRADSRLEAEPSSENSMFHGEGRGLLAVKTMQLIGALFAIFVASAAVLGSGYLDKYILSNSQARIIAGISLYNK